jgi:hypothetical protein
LLTGREESKFLYSINTMGIEDEEESVTFGPFYRRLMTMLGIFGV